MLARIQTQGLSPQFFIALFTGIIYFLFSTNLAYAQEVQWVKELDYTTAQMINPDNKKIFISDHAENLYHAGPFSQRLALDSSQIILNTDGQFLAKYNQNGDLQWVNNFEKFGSNYIQIKSIAVDQSLNVYMTGIVYGSYDFDLGSGQMILSSNQNASRIFIAKYNTNGLCLWAKQIADTALNHLYGSFKLVHELELNQQGELMLFGTFTNARIDLNPDANSHAYIEDSTSTSFMARYSSNGSYLSHFKMPIFTGGFESVKVDKANNVVLLVIPHLVHIINTTPIPDSIMLKETTLFKYDISGNLLWRVGLKNVCSGFLYHGKEELAIDDSLNILLSSYCMDTLIITKNGNQQHFLMNHSAGFVAKFDQHGEPLWVNKFDYHKQYPECHNTTATIMDMQVNTKGDYFIGGQIHDQTDMIHGPDSLLINGEGYSSAFIAKYNRNGEFKWVHKLHNSHYGHSRFYDLVISKTGRIYAIGDYSDTLYVNLQLGDTNFFEPNYAQLFILKLNDCERAHSIHHGICKGDSVFLQGSFRKEPGIFIDTLSTTYGCDSIVTTHLTVDSISDIILEQVQICNGSVYTFPNGDTSSIPQIHVSHLSKISGCDSTITTILTVQPKHYLFEQQSICSNDSVLFGGNYISAVGDYYDSLQSVVGCDSIHHLRLTNKVSYTTEESIHICQGDSAIIHGQWRKEAGLYTQYLQTTEGCDSTLSVLLSVAYIDVTVEKNQSTLMAIPQNAEYTWIDCKYNNETLSLSNRSHLTPSYTSSFAVIIQNDHCIDTSACIEINIPEVNVFPNPTQGVFVVYIPYEQVNYELLNTLGTVVSKGLLQEGLHDFSYPYLNSGVYTFRFTTSKGDVIIRRIVVQ